MPRSADPLDRLRKLCLALPEAREVEAWGEPTFRVKTIFAMYAAAGNHHGAGRAGVWIKAAPGNQELMVRAAPARFFVPPYVGPSGWIGVYLDTAETDWAELGELLRDGWRLSAPRKLVLAVEAAESGGKEAPAATGAATKPRPRRGTGKSAVGFSSSAAPKPMTRSASKRTAKPAAKRAAKAVRKSAGGKSGRSAARPKRAR